MLASVPPPKTMVLVKVFCGCPREQPLGPREKAELRFPRDYYGQPWTSISHLGSRLSRKPSTWAPAAGGCR